MTYNIAIEGPDGCGKSSLINYITAHKEIEEHVSVVSLTNFDSCSPSIKKIVSPIAKLIEYADNKNSNALALFGYFLTGIPYLAAIKEAKKKEIMIEDRTLMVSVPVYMEIYAPFLAGISSKIIDNFFEKPEEIIYLKTHKEECIRRIRNKKHRQIHESRKSLEKIISSYDALIQEVSDNSQIKVTTIETDYITADEMCEKAASVIHDAIKSAEEKNFLNGLKKEKNLKIKDMPEGPSVHG